MIWKKTTTTQTKKKRWRKIGYKVKKIHVNYFKIFYLKHKGVMVTIQLALHALRPFISAVSV